jgi:hypothetical protein
MFQSVETDENFPIRKMRSLPAGLWEIGLRPMLFGVRVSMSRTGSQFITLDYCAGDDPQMQLILLGFVCGLCVYLPEEISENDLRAIFPKETIKPIWKDKECLESLFKLGDALRAREREIQRN